MTHATSFPAITLSFAVVFSIACNSNDKASEAETGQSGQSNGTLGTSGLAKGGTGSATRTNGTPSNGGSASLGGKSSSGSDVSIGGKASGGSDVSIGGKASGGSGASIGGMSSSDTSARTGGKSSTTGNAPTGGMSTNTSRTPAGGTSSNSHSSSDVGGSSSSTNSTALCEATNLVWKSANKTNYTSYPDPGSEECIKYNGCEWTGQFAACNDTKSEEWVKSHDIVAAFPDFDTLKLHDLCLRKGQKTMVVTVLDTCGDSDCDGCCTENKGSANQLIDIESYTDARWGVADGPIEWADLGPTKTQGCN